MHFTRPSSPMIFLAVAGAMLLTTVALSFWAGCTGNLKGGALGNPVAALQVQNYSGLAAVGAAVALALATASYKAATPLIKGMLAVVSVTLPILIWFTVGWEAETQGVQQCLATP
jgi:hypothetical protein